MQGSTTTVAKQQNLKVSNLLPIGFLDETTPISTKPQPQLQVFSGTQTAAGFPSSLAFFLSWPLLTAGALLPLQRQNSECAQKQNKGKEGRAEEQRGLTAEDEGRTSL